MAMTIRQCMDAAYQLLNEYSIAGTVVPLSYNGQADMESRMVNLINAAQMEIAKTAKPIAASMSVDTTQAGSGWLRITLPADFDRLAGVKFLGRGGRFINVMDYRFTNSDALYLPMSEGDGEYIIEYYRFPVRYTATTDKNTELDNTPDTHEAIPFYVASMLYVDDSSYAYAALHNEWELKLSRLDNRLPHAEAELVDDVYGFNDFGGGS